MRIMLLFITAFLLAGCQVEQPEALATTTKDENTSANEETMEDDGTIYTEEDLEAAKEEAFQEGYDAGYEVGNDEGYELGYNDAIDGASVPALPSGSSSSSISSDLNVFSDGFAWDLALDFEKKEFIRSVLEANGQYASYSELDDYILAIDIYYENNLKMNSLGDALESLH